MKRDKNYRLLTLALVSLFALSSGLTAKSRPQAEPSPPTGMKIDHAVICESELGPIQKAFADMGLQAEYGGRHVEAPTQMSVLGFEDYSYLGLDTPVTSPAPQAVVLSKFMNGNAGPCA